VKYWIYKESRILGPFDKEAVSGLPGVDSGTLVCAGDPAAGAWLPAGELEGLTGIASGDAAGLYEDLPSSVGLLDQLQIESSGLIGDDEFPSAFSEELFQDAGFKKDFRDILGDQISPEGATVRRAQDKVEELTAKLEAMYRQVSALESGNTELARRLASKEAELSFRPPDKAPAPAPAQPAAGAKTFLSPAPPPIPGGPPPVAAVAGAPAAPAEWPAAPPIGAGFPSFGGEALAPSQAAVPPPVPELPAMPSFAAAAADAPPAAAAEPPAAPGPFVFPKPKFFKIVPTIKSFKVVGPEGAVAPAHHNALPEIKFEIAPIDEPDAIFPPPAAAPPPTTPAPAAFAPPPPPPVVLAPAPVPAPIPILAAEPPPITNPFALPARPELAAVSASAAASIPTPAPMPAFNTPTPDPTVPPPNTLSRSQPVPDPGGLSESAQQAPPATMARSGGAGEPAADALARFAKPEPAPPTGEIKKPARNNKKFLIAGGVLVTMLIVVGVIFMRQPKGDLQQMTSLDDGKAPIGVPADDVAAPPPVVKPRIAEEPAAPPPPPGPSAEHLAAVEAVKDFPLDGDRGTIGRWLQYSYTASPGAGTEEWNASPTEENTVLVEYRLVPGASGGNGALYLFEVDPNGIVMGKNIEARRMLAGGPPPEAPKAKKKPARKPKRREPVEPREVPLLPLPDSGELRPPAEDDGSFGSDTVNSGI